MKRRQLLRHAIALPAALPGLASSRALAAIQGGPRVAFGIAAQTRQLLTDPGFRDAVVRECDILTPELEMKWGFVEENQGSANLAPADQMSNFARRFGKRMHGHALIWHKSTPDWAASQMMTNPDWRIIDAFIQRIVPRYAGVVESWDVVNEPFADNGRPDGLRVSPFLTAFGPDYIRRAFERARSLAPTAKLYLNDYGFLYDDSESEARRTAALRLLEALKKHSVPVDGLGIQGHVDLERTGTFRQETFARFLKSVADMGCAIRISEFDVREHETAIPVEQRDALVADATAAVLDVAADCPALVSVTCWGLSDRYSWLPLPSETAGLNRGLPLDSDLRQKPMYRALMKALRR